MVSAKSVLIIGALLIVVILLWTGARFLNMFEASTVKNCAETDFLNSKGEPVKGEVLKGYTCPEGSRQEFADFEDVENFYLCCVSN